MGQASASSSSFLKNCVLCAYWAGSRTTNHNNTLVEYDNLSKGQCLATPAKQMKMAQESCNKFEKWSVLK